MEIMLSYVNDLPDYSDVRIPKEQIAAYLVDLMALIRALPEVCDTYEELAQKVFDALPVGYQRIDIIADTYRENSLKNSESTKRGCSKRVLIHSSKSKVSRNFADFLKNGENKTRLIELIRNELVKKRQSVLQKLRCHEIFFSMDKLCLRITVNTTDIIEELTSNQEEADTKLLLHAKHAFNSTENQAVLVRSPSGDVDINVMFIALFPEKADRVYLDYGTGKSRKVLKLSLVDIPDNLRAALVGFHAFTGNDYVSAIFRKSKRVCWKLIEKSESLLICLSD